MQQPLDARMKLLTKSPFPLMIELAIPAVPGMVVAGLYNMMDTIFVGQGMFLINDWTWFLSVTGCQLPGSTE